MKNNVRKEYDALEARLKEQSRLGAIMGIMHWDQEVIMPSGAANSRAQQLAALAGVLHDKSTDPVLGPMLERLLECPEAQFNDYERRNILEAKRDFDRETKVPKTLVAELAELSSRGHHVWAKARQENRFPDFAPVLKRLVELKTEWARVIDPEEAPYNVNIDAFERETTMAEIDPVFARLKEELVPLIRSIQNSPHQPNDALMRGTFPIAKQEALGRRISTDMGFLFDQGRMDISVHPFCGGADATDVRITTRYREDNFVESLYGVIHETGHGLYEQGRMAEWRDLPVSESLTMGIHESQSLFWERMVAQNRPFLSHYLPLFQETFPDPLKAAGLDDFYGAINLVKPSYIRVEADEVTYPMHVILRYEIEQGLFDGSIQVDDLPSVWNDKMEAYLGVRPPTDTLGVLQDVHWSGGAFGYFPSYTLGALYACQFYNALKRDLPEMEEQIAEGRLGEVKEWLNRNIHMRGKLFSARELCIKVTGEPLNPDHFLEYLKSKYASIYRLTTSV